MMGQEIPFLPENSLAAEAAETFAVRLVAWQRRCGRNDLPWQGSDPYRVWLSEVMLQQTQVRTVLPYFSRFLARFPTVEALAAAPLDEVLALWSGLGYYARARHLHAAARLWVTRWPGSCPQGAQEWAQLPGVGRSTAAAIAAFVQRERVPILDGNVQRVLCRLFAVEEDPRAAATARRLWDAAHALLPRDPDDMPAYTQGMMDLGALVCTRTRPRCDLCPVAELCAAHRLGIAAQLPRKRARAPVPEQDVRWGWYEEDGAVWLVRRAPQGIWGGLWCLPPADEAPPGSWRATGEIARLTHRLTHFTLKITVTRYLPETPRAAEPAAAWGEDARCLAPHEALALGVPQPLRRLLERAVDAPIEHAKGNMRRLGVAKGKFEVSERIDEHDEDVARLFRGKEKP
ncbi:MAG: A/G-specific adenine glycosylase [Tepidiphilus sp.]|nr:A/G-specific adenine glycosylase [Tepidiphilus sp.]